MLNLLRLGSPSSESSDLVITYVPTASTGLDGVLRVKTACQGPRKYGHHARIKSRISGLGTDGFMFIIRTILLVTDLI